MPRVMARDPPFAGLGFLACGGCIGGVGVGFIADGTEVRERVEAEDGEETDAEVQDEVGVVPRTHRFF